MTRDRLEEIESLEELEERRFERRLGEEMSGPRRGVNVLVVESDEAFRELFVAWLSEAGLNVQSCPGPQEPVFECGGASRYGCPLADSSDLVVLDLELESDLLVCGVAAWELLHYYRSLGRPVVVLSGTEDALTPVPGDRIAVLRRPPEHKNLVDAARVLLLHDEPRPALQSDPTLSWRGDAGWTRTTDSVKIGSRSPDQENRNVREAQDFLRHVAEEPSSLPIDEL